MHYKNDAPHSPKSSSHPKASNCMYEFKSAFEQSRQTPSGFVFSGTSTIIKMGKWNNLCTCISCCAV